MRVLKNGFLIGIVLASMAGFAATAALPPEQNRLKPEDAPVPYSIGELRAAFPAGTWVRFSGDNLFNQKEEFILRVTSATAESATVEMTTLDGQGKPAGETRAVTAAWKELQALMSFQQKLTTICRVSVETFKGRQDCWLYEVGNPQAAEEVTRYWFAVGLPGPPVRMELYKGKVLARSLQITAMGRE